MTPKEFFDKVVEMRRCQKEYLKNKRQIDLRISKQFVEKLAEHGNGIALLFNRCDSNKFQDIIFTKATGMMFLRNRIKFFRPDGTRGDSPGCGSVLIAFGRENAEILRNCSLQGKYVELNNDK